MVGRIKSVTPRVWLKLWKTIDQTIIGESTLVWTAESNLDARTTRLLAPLTRLAITDARHMDLVLETNRPVALVDASHPLPLASGPASGEDP